MSEPMLDAAGRRRSPATLPEFHAGRPPRNKGMRYPADPPTIEEIVTVMQSAGDGVHGRAAWSSSKASVVAAGCVRSLRHERRRCPACCT